MLYCLIEEERFPHSLLFKLVVHSIELEVSILRDIHPWVRIVLLVFDGDIGVISEGILSLLEINCT